MQKYYYYTRDDMILRDHLATDRTVLANERTFLAYIRTSLSITVAGASFIKFFDVPLVHLLGYVFIPLGLFIGIVGMKRFYKVSKRLKHLAEFESVDLEEANR